MSFVPPSNFDQERVSGIRAESEAAADRYQRTHSDEPRPQGRLARLIGRLRRRRRSTAR